MRATQAVTPAPAESAAAPAAAAPADAQIASIVLATERGKGSRR